MTTPRLLLFDLGNVLVRFLPERFPESLGLDVQDVRNAYEGPMRDLTNRYESGGCSTDEYFSSLNAIFDNRFDIEKLKKAFASVLGDPIAGMEDIVRKVVQTTPSALVSNTNEYHFTGILPRVPALMLLPKRYLSYQIRAIKPSLAFYENVIRNETVLPGEMLFIDDVETNIESALTAGMQGFLFQSAGELGKFLTESGVL